jgi:hypothetical protein
MHRTGCECQSLHPSASSMHRSRSTPLRWTNVTASFLEPVLCIELVSDHRNHWYLGLPNLHPNSNTVSKQLLCLELILNDELFLFQTSPNMSIVSSMHRTQPGGEGHPHYILVTLLCIELGVNVSPYILVPVLCIEVNPHLWDGQG